MTVDLNFADAEELELSEPYLKVELGQPLLTGTS
jgi:hypothetical protein